MTARFMSRLMDDEPTDETSALDDHPPELLRISEEDEQLQACANAIFRDAEIRAKWGFPARRPAANAAVGL